MCAASVLISGCHRAETDSSASASGQAAASQESDYVVPPELTSASRVTGGVVLSGRSDPNARVRLLSPDGNAYGATATAAGAWTLTVPVQGDLREFGVSEVLGEGDIQKSRNIQGQGYYALLPNPGRPAVLLRAGGGSQALSQPPAGPQVTTIDFDTGGGAVVSGLAKPGSPVRVSVDGAAAADIKADARGWFSLVLSGVLKPGEHEAVVQSAEGSDRAAFSVAPAAAITALPYHGLRQQAGWRIDWVTPGGSVQTTLVIDPPGGAS